MDVSEREDFVRKPRERTMPLLPTPFKTCHEAKAKAWNVFIPDLNVTEYLKTLNEPQEKELRNRAENLTWRARRVDVPAVSEFYWEASAWHDVFGMINNDDNFILDKRPYKYVEADNAGKIIIKKRIPDATFGIKFFEPMSLAFQHHAYRRDPKKKKPHPLLYERRVIDMMRNPRCGLVVDGMWGETSLIFPFAAYEAKNNYQDHDAAEKQIKHACRTYLAMLDDLARNPNNVSEYQTEESPRFQFFAFTSNSSYWRVSVAWSSSEDCVSNSVQIRTQSRG
ncbi:hypothetical protein N5P37_004616 [Trichoderma harzianum]|nr:hypothetical protein N5P37_004616 [Trichoderma harzianum]